METRNDDKNLEIYIAGQLIDDVLWYDDSIWQKNVEYAVKLIQENKPIEKMKNFELSALIAYTAFEMLVADVEDAQSARYWEKMRHTFWFAVWCLATNKLKTWEKLKAKV